MMKVKDEDHHTKYEKKIISIMDSAFHLVVIPVSYTHLRAHET